MAKRFSTIVKGWIGLRVQWEDCRDPIRGTYRLREGTLTDVQGRNVEINHDGWKWLPDLHGFKLKDTRHEEHED